MVKRGVVEAVQEGQHLLMRLLELGPELLRRNVTPAAELSGVPAVRVEVSGNTALAGGHASDRTDKTSFGTGQVGQQVAHGPALVRMQACPAVWPDPIESRQQLLLCV